MHTIRAAGIGDCEALANILQEYPDIPYRDPDRIISCLQESGFSEGSVFRCFIAELVTQGMVNTIHSSHAVCSIRSITLDWITQFCIT